MAEKHCVENRKMTFTNLLKKTKLVIKKNRAILELITTDTNRKLAKEKVSSSRVSASE